MENYRKYVWIAIAISMTKCSSLRWYFHLININTQSEVFCFKHRTKELHAPLRQNNNFCSNRQQSCHERSLL